MTQKNSDLVYSSDLVFCPIEEFETYLGSIGESFPYVASANKASFESVYNDFLLSPYAYESRVKALTYAEQQGNNYVVRFYAMDITTTLRGSEGSAIASEARDGWNSFIDGFVASCPENLCNSVENVAHGWCWLAIMHLNGWKFGVSESVAIVIIIGFSIDYVVHLANAYLESSSHSREERLSFAMLTMGISVVSGAVTTFGAGFFLTFPAFVIFRKMGIVMVQL